MSLSECSMLEYVATVRLSSQCVCSHKVQQTFSCEHTDTNELSVCWGVSVCIAVPSFVMFTRAKRSQREKLDDRHMKSNLKK